MPAFGVTDAMDYGSHNCSMEKWYARQISVEGTPHCEVLKSMSENTYSYNQTPIVVVRQLSLICLMTI